MKVSDVILPKSLRQKMSSNPLKEDVLVTEKSGSDEDDVAKTTVPSVVAEAAVPTVAVEDAVPSVVAEAAVPTVVVEDAVPSVVAEAAVPTAASTITTINEEFKNAKSGHDMVQVNHLSRK